MLHKYIVVLACLFIYQNTLSCQDVNAQLTGLVDAFFDALERQDTTALHAMYLDGAHDHYISEKVDPHRIGSRPSKTFVFRQGQILKERAKAGEVVVIHDNSVASAWVPYDLWVNDVYEHCGVDIFSFIRTDSGWKIASITYSMVREDCR